MAAEQLVSLLQSVVVMTTGAEASASAVPWLLMVWPVKTWLVEVPAASVSVTVAV